MCIRDSYDDITKIAATTCNVPISLMTLVDKDKQWFKSKIGLQISETRRDWSFCTHAIKENSPLIIHDASKMKDLLIIHW